MTWRPLSVREGRGTPDHEILHDGVPPWIVKAVVDWTRERVSRVPPGKYERTWNPALLKDLELQTHFPLDWSAGHRGAGEYLLLAASRDPDRFLDALDFLITQPNCGEHEAEELNSILTKGGSLWTVEGTSQGRHLSRRVSEGAAAAVREAIASSVLAGALLEQAWQEAYGRGPNPSASYDHAVKAVETAAHDVVTPKDPKPTLGKMIAAMRAAPAKWEILVGSAKGIENTEAVIGMMDLLWTGHVRHGASSGILEASPEEAAAAVLLAATLVQWFAAGAVRPRS